MKLIFFVIMFLLSCGYIQAQRPERDSAEIAEFQKKLVKKMEDEDKMKLKALQDAERDERNNPTHRRDSLLRKEHERIFSKRPPKR